MLRQQRLAGLQSRKQATGNLAQLQRKNLPQTLPAPQVQPAYGIHEDIAYSHPRKGIGTFKKIPLPYRLNEKNLPYINAPFDKSSSMLFRTIPYAVPKMANRGRSVPVSERAAGSLVGWGSIYLLGACGRDPILKGHDFSRAANGKKRHWALAPEGRLSVVCIPPVAKQAAENSIQPGISMAL